MAERLHPFVTNDDYLRWKAAKQKYPDALILIPCEKRGLVFIDSDVKKLNRLSPGLRYYEAHGGDFDEPPRMTAFYPNVETALMFALLDTVLNMPLHCGCSRCNGKPMSEGPECRVLKAVDVAPSAN